MSSSATRSLKSCDDSYLVHRGLKEAGQKGKKGEEVLVESVNAGKRHLRCNERIIGAGQQGKKKRNKGSERGSWK